MVANQSDAKNCAALFNMSCVRKDVNTEMQKSGNTENRINEKEKVREEFKLPFKLAEQLRAYAFENRITKTKIVIKALEELLKKQ